MTAVALVTFKVMLLIWSMDSSSVCKRLLSIYSSSYSIIWLSLSRSSLNLVDIFRKLSCYYSSKWLQMVLAPASTAYAVSSLSSIRSSLVRFVKLKYFTLLVKSSTYLIASDKSSCSGVILSL